MNFGDLDQFFEFVRFLPKGQVLLARFFIDGADGAQNIGVPLLILNEMIMKMSHGFSPLPLKYTSK